MTPLEKLEDEAALFYGPATAISVDRATGCARVTVWDALGIEKKLVAVGSTKDAAVAKARIGVALARKMSP